MSRQIPEGMLAPVPAPPSPATGDTMTYEQWEAEAHRRFGGDFRDWAFECPCCGNVAKVGEFEPHGAPADAATMECIGRYVGAGEPQGEDKIPVPCDYAGYGLIQLSPVRVRFPDGNIRQCFAFAPEGEGE